CSAYAGSNTLVF
nr:immunoglobulin light chain junction region [Macaca mulatta]MPN67004.1 immunoglobulin light chain junction region [Macaca mulatta]